MALYASDEDGHIFAADAAPGMIYWCLECSGRVKVRRGKDRFPHFYHLSRSPLCRLYSKSDDHLLVQLHLQKVLSLEMTQMERSIPSIQRISDLCWEKEKIAFEIQCSSIELSEARKRVLDYTQAGYRIVWLLDDRVFNQRAIRTAEKFLRTQICYFFSFQKKIGVSQFYDQMEIMIERKRLQKGAPLRIDLSKPCAKPSLDWPIDLPIQIQERIHRSDLYFQGDLLHKVIQSTILPAISIYFSRWRKLEEELFALHRPLSRWCQFLEIYMIRPYHKILNWLIRNTS